jgi:hypothetical protein
VHVTATGKFDTWPVSIWVDTPAIHFNCDKDKGAFTVQCDKDAPLGPHLVRFYNGEGTTYPRVFMVGADPEVLEVEPNDTPKNAQHIAALPVTINGRLQQYDDTDCYAVKLAAGQRLVASLQCRRLGAGVQPMLHILDAAGFELAYTNGGIGLDNLMAFTAQRAGVYIVRVSGFHDPPDTEVRLVGDPSDIYRLHLTTGPFINHVTPAGVQRGQQATLQAGGWNLLAGANDFPIDAKPIAAFWEYFTVPTPSGEMLRVEIADGPEYLAAQVKDKPLTAPACVNGCLEENGQHDTFAIAAKKGEAFHFSVLPTVMGSACDPVLWMETEPGKVVPGALDWSAPDTKTYHLFVADQYHNKGGADYGYHLRIEHPKPALQANPSAAAYTVAWGKTIDVGVSEIRITGHNTPLMAIASGLPAGVTVTSAELPTGGGSVTLKLTAAADVKAFSGVIHVMFVGTDPLRPEVDTALFNLRTEKDITQQMVDLCEPWLTVIPAPPAPATTQAATKPVKK